MSLCRGPADSALDEGVGHELAAAAPVPAGGEPLGLGVEGGIHGHAVGDRKVGRHVGHGVRSRPDRHAPVGRHPTRPRHRTRRVEALGDGARLTLHLPVPQEGEPRPDLRVDRGPVLDAQVCRLAGHERGAPLAALPRRQHRQGVRHLVDQRLGQAQQPRPAVRRLPPGQGHLIGDATPHLLARHAERLLLGTLGGVEGDGLPGLRSRRRMLDPLQQCDPVDPIRVVAPDLGRGQPGQEVLQLDRGQAEGSRCGARRQRCIEHVFDSSRPRRQRSLLSTATPAPGFCLCGNYVIRDGDSPPPRHRSPHRRRPPRARHPCAPRRQ